MSSEVDEIQNEEAEALISIYEGDTNFKQISPKIYQYKVLDLCSIVLLPC